MLLASVLGVELTHVPYKGMSPAINDVAGGHIPFMFSPIPFAQPLAQAGKLRMLGVTTAERIEAIPDVPPLTEIGVKEFDAVSWFMLVAPAGTPRRHRRQAVTARSGPSSATRRCAAELTRLGLLPVQSPPPDELKALCRGRNRALGRYRQEGRAGRIAIGQGRRAVQRADRPLLFGPAPFDK